MNKKIMTVVLPAFFKQPVWNVSDNKAKNIIAAGSGVFIVAILILLQPFTIHHQLISPLFILSLSGYGVIASAILLLFEFIIKSKIASYDTEKIPLYRFIIWYIGILIIVSIGNYFYYKLLQVLLGHTAGFNFPDKSWLDFLYRTTALAFFLFVGFGIYFRMRFQFKELEYNISTTNGLIQISSERNNDFLRIPQSVLLYIEAKGNYVEVSYLEGNTIRAKLLRTTLKKVETEVHLAALVRCHKAYIVNLKRIKSFHPQSAGAAIELYGIDKVLPVSRSYLLIVKEQMDKIKQQNFSFSSP
jgi:hypothetical protein